MRIPGFRDGKLAERVRDHKLHYKGRRALWASGQSGGLVNDEVVGGVYTGRIGAMLEEEERKGRDDMVDWKRQFKIRHNWARGKCAVEELKLGPDPEEEEGTVAAEDDEDRTKMLVKVVEGFAVTADRTFGLRAWDLKTREVVAHISLDDDRIQGPETKHDIAPPSCIAIDDHHWHKGTLDIALGFADGSFGVWRLDLHTKNLARRYRHESSSNGGLEGMAYSHPYLFTATGAVLVSLYTFDVPRTAEEGDEGGSTKHSSSKLASAMSEYCDDAGFEETQKNETILLPAPYLLTALKSHTSDPPLALCIRETGNTTVASIAYTFYTRRGWSIGIQDLHITPSQPANCAPNITTRLAYTAPMAFSGALPVTTPRAVSRRIPLSPPQVLPTSTPLSNAFEPPPPVSAEPRGRDGPTTLCYSHPYLLATLPDNTLILHLCTSTSSTLSVSPGLRLWGHTSGISDAEITARGKAVSVSSRGEEMRVWELEGRSNGVRSRSVEIRPKTATDSGRGCVEHEARTIEGEEVTEDASKEAVDWEERRNWVGFDDEMVIVLKEARGGRESLLVYDFT